MGRRSSYATSALAAMLAATAMASCRASSPEVSSPADLSTTSAHRQETPGPGDETPTTPTAPTAPATPMTPATPTVVPAVLDLDAKTDASTVAAELTNAERTIRSDG
ncbi:MAG TPA: hypothetical protein VIT64_16030, partial [Ilumatobacteraceae bacterium]